MLCFSAPALANPPIYISFLWHYHQPVYVPYEETYTTILNNGPAGGPSFGFSLHEMWSSKGGPYRSWPIDAVESGMNAGLQHLGTQCSLTGALIESLNNLDFHNWNGDFYGGWKARWQQGISWTTSNGNPRVELIGFPFHHSLGGLVFVNDLELQIELHKRIYLDAFGGSYSRGYFPAETSFHERMIPALVAADIDWVIVDNIHFNRTLNDYPWTGASGVIEPNPADQIGMNLADVDPGAEWIQLNGLWAPERVTSWAYRPKYISWTDPATSTETRMVAIPAACYMGNEDARGGFGALNYDAVMSQLEPYNTDDDHPILILLHHDGENFGAGSESYYHSNFQNFVNWCLSNPSRFVPTTIQDYMEMFPPDQDDVIHVEPGGWIGSGCLDPEFHYWLGDPNPFPDGYSPDWNSWSAITAAHNWVWTAHSIAPWTSIANILTNTGNQTEQAFHDFLCAEASDYEYWEGGGDQAIWNSNASRACNLAVDHAESVVSGHADTVGPTIFKPQRQPYNPGGMEWRVQQPADFMVWSFIYDLSGVSWATVKYRIDPDRVVDQANKVYAGGSWLEAPMAGSQRPSESIIEPEYLADFYTATITDQNQVLVDYYIEAQDSQGNLSRSEICHVVIGAAPSCGNDRVSWDPCYPTYDEPITVWVYNPGEGGWLHWGVNAQGHEWTTPDESYWPAGSELYQGGDAVQTPLEGPDENGDYWITIGPFNNPAQHVDTVDFVIHFTSDRWDNNDGNDYHIELSEPGTPTPTPTVTPTYPTATPTPSPGPGTPTATPTPSPSPGPGTPTATPSPRPDTPTATPSPGPGTPTATPTATSTVGPGTPTYTPIPTGILVRLGLNQPWYTANDPFSLSLTISNGAGAAMPTDLYIVLEAFGSYYFHPLWTGSPFGSRRELPPGITGPENVLTFQVPAGVPPSGPFIFYAACMEAGTINLISNLDVAVFGFY